MRLRRYQFDDIVPPQLKDRVLHLFGGADASVYAFANKLCRKLDWKMPFALTAIAEYKKFVYLGATSPFPVTPPKVIDQVWHEHLLFTHGYLTFCQDVLRSRFDHYPELIPTDDQTGVFQDQYRQTLDLYEREFNTPPREDLWGTPKFKRRSKVATAAQSDGFLPSDGPPLHEMVGSSSSHVEFGGFGGGLSGGAGASSLFDSPSADSAGSGDAAGGDAGGGDGGSGCGSGCSSSGCGGGGGD